MINRVLDRLEEWLIAFLIAAATLVIFAAVVHRFLCGVPWIQDYAVRLNVSWAQELCIFMFVWMAKFGAAYGVRTGIHVGVDVIVRKLKGRPQRALIQAFMGVDANRENALHTLARQLAAAPG